MSVPGAEVPRDPYRDRWVPIGAWALYDFANTIFSALVVTQYLPALLKAETGQERPMAWAGAASLMLSAVLGPFLGAVADATGKTKPQVMLWSAICCAGGASLALVPPGHPWVLIGIFIVANLAYNVSISLYDAFLPDLCSPSRMGFVSGIGVGVGYLGALLGYPLAMFVTHHHGDRSAFVLAGGLMALFAIPFFIFVRERSTREPRKFTWALGFAELKSAHATIRGLPKNPVLFLFLAGNLMAVDSLNSMIQWAAQFFRDPAAFAADNDQVTFLLIGLSLTGTVAGFVAGKLCDRIGAFRILMAAVLSLAAVAAIDSTSSSRSFAMGCTMIGGGFGAAGIWLAGRRMLVDLAPPDRIGEYMGLLGITRKASVCGTVVLATLADSRGWRYAILALVVPLLLGAVALLASQRLNRKRSEFPPLPR